MAEIELKPCPNCKAKDEIEVWNIDGHSWVVRCGVCGCMVDWTDTKADTKTEAIELWNRRVDNGRE